MSKNNENWKTKYCFKRSILQKYEFVGCFYCMKIYKYSEIKDFVDRGQTAVCPKCGIDAVCAYDINNHEEFLMNMKKAHKSSFED